jgi:hypothetical protein
MPELFHILKMISAGEMVEARQELAAVLKRDPNHLEAWSLMALAVTAPAQKADCYRRVLALDPNNENARYQLAILEKMLKAPASAVSAAVNTAAPPTRPAPMPASPPASAPSTPAVSSIDRLIATAPVPATVEPMPAPAEAAERLTPAAVVAALTMNPIQPAEQATAPANPTDAPAAASGESCSQQMGYLGVGVLIMSVAGMFLGGASTLTTGPMYGSVPETAAAVICYGTFALLIMPLFIYLAHKGWDTGSEMNLLLKFAWLFVVALPTPWGWYWMGRGASRLIQAWANRYKPGAHGRPQKNAQPASAK